MKGEKNLNISQHILDRNEASTGEYPGTGKTESGSGNLERTGAHELGHSKFQQELKLMRCK